MFESSSSYTVTTDLQDQPKYLASRERGGGKEGRKERKTKKEKL